MNAPHAALAAPARFQWDDPLLLEAQLGDEERMVREAARRYAQERLAPRVTEAFRHETADPAVFREMGALGLLGPTIPEAYGGPGLGYVSYGLIAREIERVDSGYRSMMSVQSSLVMLPIHAFGSEAQRRHYLPRLASGEWIGCFGLTEPDHGSDPGSMVTRARRVGSGFRLTGSKMWISNSPIADVFVVWAKNDEGRIRGYVLDKGLPGLSAPVTHGKIGLRASITGEIVMDEVPMPAPWAAGSTNSIARYQIPPRTMASENPIGRPAGSASPGPLAGALPSAPSATQKRSGSVPAMCSRWRRSGPVSSGSGGWPSRPW